MIKRRSVRPSASQPFSHTHTFTRALSLCWEGKRSAAGGGGGGGSVCWEARECG